jgi:hypothetical protein
LFILGSAKRRRRESDARMRRLAAKGRRRKSANAWRRSSVASRNVARKRWVFSGFYSILT